MEFFGSIGLRKNQIQNLIVENGPVNPTIATQGRLFMNTGDSCLYLGISGYSYSGYSGASGYSGFSSYSGYWINLINGTTSTMPIGTIAYFGTSNNIPTSWKLCDGNDGTPDLRDLFFKGNSTTGYGNYGFSGYSGYSTGSGYFAVTGFYGDPTYFGYSGASAVSGYVNHSHQMAHDHIQQYVTTTASSGSFGTQTASSGNNPGVAGPSHIHSNGGPNVQPPFLMSFNFTNIASNINPEYKTLKAIIKV